MLKALFVLGTLAAVWFLYSASQQNRRAWVSPLLRENAIDGHLIACKKASSRSAGAAEWVALVDVRNLRDQPIELLDLPMLRVRMTDGSTIVGHVFSRTIQTSHGLYYDDPKDGDTIPPRGDRELLFVCYSTKETSPDSQPIHFAFATQHEEKVIR